MYILVCVRGDLLVKSNQKGPFLLFFKKGVNSELAVPVPNLLAMCELAIFYTLY